MKYPYFATYEHHINTGDGQLVTRYLIVLVQACGIKQFTDFHRFVKPRVRVARFSSDFRLRYKYVVQLLNYAFFVAGITRLDDLTVGIVKSFLTAYGMCSLPWDDDDKTRSSSTVERCVSTVLDFCIEVARERKGFSKIKEEDLYKTISKRNKHGKTVDVRVPVFDVKYAGTYASKQIFRDIPDKAFRLLFDHIVRCHKEILGLVILSAFAGLRPSEACNVRRLDSAIGPGFFLEEVNGELLQVQIDLRRELQLRSDGVSVGKIKKERLQLVPDIFLQAFWQSYNIYMQYLAGKSYESVYGPFTINTQGKALTYDSYRKKFHAIIRDEMIPIFLNSGDPELVIYGRTLMEHNLSPHVFRHWYTVQLVLSGVNDPNSLAFYRGDTSRESAMVYLENKGDLLKRHNKVSDEMFNYVMWAATEQEKSR